MSIAIDRVRVSVDQGVADVRLVRADKMNAMDDAMFDALIETGEALKRDQTIRAVVLSGDGKAFCAGLDTENFGKMASGAPRRNSDLAAQRRTPGGANRPQQAVLVWREQPAPVIAAVHGAAFGAGFQLALGADIRIVAPDARMAILEIKWGLVPDMGAYTLLPGLIRDDLARELTYTGRIFSGEEAVSFGLAARVSADPYASALTLAREIAGKSPDATRAAKRLFEGARTWSRQDILRQETLEQVALIGSPNQKEAIMANLEKRPPQFSDPA
ncbi:MAG: crotonase/enoyl-CoA hydratase family protein [Alphaproteobacteria bacterium]|jgi:enoyl-CoA hydratase/carnithine racemase|nr:crotonase/enoyl-CoA hydratase family protein [Alphaproteobacteria bacterium]